MYNNLSIDDVFDLMDNNVDFEKLISVMGKTEFHKRDYDDRRVMAFIAMTQFMIMLRRSPLSVRMSMNEEMVDVVLMLLFDYVRGVLC